MNILYVVANVLGDAGANAAEIFPKLAIQSPDIDKLVVADFYRNKTRIEQNIFAEHLKLRYGTRSLRAYIKNAGRLARYAKDNDMDIIHVFYRQVNVPLVIFLRLALMVIRCKAKIIVDHRSVNLAKGRKRVFKMFQNALMQPFVHQLTGNPLATKSNHWFIYKPDDIIDLGYDTLPNVEIEKPAPDAPKSVWFIGTMKPKNRKSEFLFEIFDELERRLGDKADFKIRVAGPVRPDQLPYLERNSLVEYYGTLPRNELYHLLSKYPGIGIAYMNKEHHALAPSLKFSEYASMGYAIVASNTVGMKIQAERMAYKNVSFAEETPESWAEQLVFALHDWPESFTLWGTKNDWSYESIFTSQVIPIYEKLSGK